MHASRRTFALAIATALTGSIVALGNAGLAGASEPDYMNKRLLEQSVLRAQPGPQLGQWTQNFYFDDVFSASDLRPLVCPTRTKTPITLPKADSKGQVGYQTNQGATLSITVWQYKKASDAQAAADKLAAVSCPDSPKVTWETPGEYYQAEGGSDSSESIVAGNRAYIGGYVFTVDGDSPSVNYGVRVVGTSVVRVEAIVVNSTTKQYNAASRLINSWVDRASNAVMKFSSMDPNAA